MKQDLQGFSKSLYKDTFIFSFFLSVALNFVFLRINIWFHFQIKVVIVKYPFLFIFLVFDFSEWPYCQILEVKRSVW